MFTGGRSRFGIASVALCVFAGSAGRAENREVTVIEDGRSVSIEYTLKLDDGTTVDGNVGEEPLVYLQGGREILPALEAALAGHKVGDTESVKLTAEQGYGPIDPEAFQEVEIGMVPEDARSAGVLLVVTSPDGQEQPIRVHEVRDETIVLDFNHPLAGQALNFDIKILGIE